MADLILSLQQIEDLIWNLTMQMLGYNPSDMSTSNQSKVRMAWPSEGAPAWQRTDDVAFLRINNFEDPITMQRDIEYQNYDVDNANQIVSYTRVHQVQWVLYGPNSFDNAEKIKNALFRQDIKKQYNALNLYLVLDIVPPIRLPEPFNNQWWERTDFTAKFNEKIEVSATVPYLKSVDIILVKGDK